VKRSFDIARKALASVCAAACVAATAVPSRAADPIKITVITDMSGIYASLAGAGAVMATKMAVEDFGGSVLGRKIEVVAVDHRNNPTEPRLKPAKPSTAVRISRST
jgi:branched-chain amino acid transport system substrate-binding protein